MKDFYTVLHLPHCVSSAKTHKSYLELIKDIFRVICKPSFLARDMPYLSIFYSLLKVILEEFEAYFEVLEMGIFHEVLR